MAAAPPPATVIDGASYVLASASGAVLPCLGKLTHSAYVVSFMHPDMDMILTRHCSIEALAATASPAPDAGLAASDPADDVLASS